LKKLKRREKIKKFTAADVLLFDDGSMSKHSGIFRAVVQVIML
jgi:hypothetical protein